jgi:MSHA biogenesis protein MshN
MGLLSMSVINQMLQDLDARRSEALGADLDGQHIRAVPKRRRIHPAWWATLPIGMLLAGVVAWGVLRPHPSAGPVHPIAPRDLPLKLDTDLDIDLASAQAAQPQEPVVQAYNDVEARTPTQTNPVVEQTQARPTFSSQSSPTRQANGQAIIPAVVEKPELSSQSPAPALLPKEMAPSPDLPKVTLPKPVVTATPGKPAEQATPVAVTKQIKELTPQQRAENEYRKAIILVQQGKAGEAVGGLEQALQLDPQHAAARQTLVGVLLDTGRRDEAAGMAREALSTDPAQPGLAMILARLRLEKGEVKSAVETLQRTLPYAADRADYQSFLAALLQRDGRNKEAADHFLLALQKAPQNGVWWMGLGISLQAEHRLTEAQEAFGRARSSNSLSPELHAFVESKLKQLQR